MEVRELDAVAATDDELLALHALEASCSPPGDAVREAALSLAYYRHWPAGEIRRRWLVEEDDVLAGSAALIVHAPKLVHVDILVRRDKRRRGIGTALLQTVQAAARAAEVTSFFGHHWDDAGAAFAAQMGAQDDQRDVRALLQLRSADLPVPTLPPTWRLQSWVGAAPGALVASFARARDAMNDAPAPDGLEWPPMTVAEVRRIEETAALRGREVRVTVALDEADEVGAFTDLRVTPGSAAASTDDTAVSPPRAGSDLDVR